MILTGSLLYNCSGERKEKLVSERRFMEAQMSEVFGASYDQDKEISASPRILQHPSRGGRQLMSSLIRELLTSQDQVDRTEHKRTLLLKKLISKVQPELAEEEVEARVETLREKFKFFSLKQLRELVGDDDTSEEEEADFEEAREEKKEDDDYNEEERSSEDVFEDTVGGKASTVTEEALRRSLGMFAEEYLDEDEEALLESAGLNEEELAELEDEITTEFKKQLSEMGWNTKGRVW